MIPDDLDLRLLQELQDAFPLERDPWRTLGGRLGCGGDEVLARVQRLADDGVIRSIGPVMEASRVGLAASTLVALRVPEDRIDAVARLVNAHDEVSHNYRRDHAYNLWFTLAGEDRGRLEAVIDAIRRETGIGEPDLLELPTVRRFKIDVRFRCREEAHGSG